MSKNTSIALGLGATALCASQAFVPTTTSNLRSSPAHSQDAGVQQPRASAASGASSFARAGATLSAGACALMAARAFSGVRTRRSAFELGWKEMGVGKASPEEEKFIAGLKKDLGFASGLIGNQSGFGTYNFDPLNLAEKNPEALPWYREAELKHGRICMLAWLGLVVPEFVRIPGPGPCYTASVIDAHKYCVTSTLDNFDDQRGPLLQVFLFTFVIEMTTTYPKIMEGITNENAGDYRLGVNFLPKELDKIEEMKLKELKNGRLAMLAFGGAITQAVLSGNSFPWLFSANGRSSQGAGLGSSVPMTTRKGGFGAGASRVTMKAAGGGYKMSKAVPFLPVSPALEGYVGEEDGFDPLGFSLAIDIRWLREAEIKHARVCMLAVTGWITTDLGMRVPGDIFQVSTVEAHDAAVKTGAFPQLLCWLGYAEIFGFLAITNMMEGTTERKPGDFGLRWLYPGDEKGQYDMQLKELRNGRLAMLAFSGCATASVLSGQTWPFFQAIEDGPTSGGVATRALETSRSLPFLPKPKNLKGFVGEEAEFDPLEFSKTFDIRWLREAELKHGRVCMLAASGFLLQSSVADVPDALQAVYAVPPVWAVALLGFGGYVESTTYGGKVTMLDMFDGPAKDRAPGDFNFGSGFMKGVWPGYGGSEKEQYDLKLRELNNGRLAMLAFSGMVHHNLVVKGPLFPLVPDGWAGPQGSWQVQSFMGYIGGVEPEGLIH